MDYQQAGRFSTIPARALFDPNLDNAALRVLGILGCYSDRSGWCFPAITTLAKETGVSRQAISKQIGVLIALGYLKSQKRFRKDGGQTSNRYQVLFDTSDPGGEEQAPPIQVDPPQPQQVAASQPQQVAPVTPQVTAHLISSSPDGEKLQPAAISPPKFSKAERSAMWDAFEEGVGVEAITKADGSNLGGIVKDCLESGVTPEEVLAACKEYRRRWPDIDITWRAVYNNLSKLLAMIERRNRPHGLSI